MNDSLCVLVTGGANRLGRAIVEACAMRGWSVVIHCNRSTDAAEKLAGELREKNITAAVVQADLGITGQVQSLFSSAKQKIGRPITALVNSASIFEWDDLTSFEAEGALKHFSVNTIAPVMLCRKLVEQLEDGQRASIVNLLDHKLAAPYGDHLSYTLSKYALAGAMDILARSYPDRLRINSVAPGYTLPAPGQSDQDFQRIHPQTPLGIGPEPDDVAGAVTFLLGSKAITGQTLYVDAGARFAPGERDHSFR